MKLLKLTLSFVLLATLGTGCAYKHRPLVNPEVTFIKDVDPNVVQRAVHKALTDKRWTVDDEKPGSTFAHLQKGHLLAKVRVDYSEMGAKVIHVETKNFNYSNRGGDERIHSHYLNWANNIAKGIRINVGFPSP